VSHKWRVAIAAIVAVSVATGLLGCNNNTESVATSSASTSNCLPDVKLVDQYGQQVSLASLRGKPVLFDFFYTSCPGPCLVLTARMRPIADKLGSELGSEVSFVSLSVDPEHDSPA
jgi:cytochrome oxidase Cu insertion factor (SCO1/SenC/PrrC family)